MSLDVIICRNISFVGCILIVAVTELNKILRSLFIALQWRRRCISSSISFNSHLVHIRWFIGVIGLLYRPLSIFRSCELIWYLPIACSVKVAETYSEFKSIKFNYKKQFYPTADIITTNNDVETCVYYYTLVSIIS